MTTKTTETNAKQAMATGTIRLHRVLKAPPECVYKAILDPAAMCKWLPPNGLYLLEQGLHFIPVT